MSPSSSYNPENGPQTPRTPRDANPPTIAAFSPSTLSGTSSATKQRSTIIVHKKSPLLVATPPQVTRTLAYSHPFILPLNKFVGLLSWSSGDPWESFLLVAAFWAVTIYGDDIVRWAGPIIIVVSLILAMYSRRYSPLSSTEWTGRKRGHKKQDSEGGLKHHKTLDEILDTLREFTTRCQILLDPALRLTEFLSTQTTATSATTRPALTALFIRILLVTPVWILLTFPPLYIVSTRRVVLFCGTIALTWHSRPARVSRVILWRSLTVRRICSVLTGLTFSEDPEETATAPDGSSVLPSQSKSQQLSAENVATKRRPDSSGVRFTFILYENQRRWLGIGWTYSLFAYERAAWTDEQLNPAPSKDEFELPDVEGGNARWRWVEGSEWKIEGADHPSAKGKGTPQSQVSDGGGWIYYDNKWDDGRRGEDSWGRYTRRRKWYRDAELVEITTSTEVTPSSTPNAATNSNAERSADEITPSRPSSDFQDMKGRHSAKPSVDDTASVTTTGDDDTENSSNTGKKKRRWFGGSSADRGKQSSKDNASVKTGKGSVDSMRSRDDDESDVLDRWTTRNTKEEDWGIGDDVRMGLS